MKTISRWQTYCTTINLKWWLATSNDIIGFLEGIRQSNSSCKQTTIYQHLSALSFYYKLQRKENPCAAPIVSMYMRGLKRYDIHIHPTVRQAKPITKDILNRLNVLLAGSSASLRIWRTVWRINAAFYTLLRWDDISRLQVCSITFPIAKFFHN